MRELLFPQKLHKILDDNLFEEIISWQPHGRSFKVHQQGDFMKKVYPIYFKKTVKYPSFQRQLSYYGFRRQELPGPDKGGYYHPHFLRGCFSLCTQQVYRHVEREQEADENTLPCYDKCSTREIAGGLKVKSPLYNKQGSKVPEPMFYEMTPLPSLPNQVKSKADKEEFNDTRRSHHDRDLHPFMTMMGPDPPSSDSFRSDTNEYYPRYGHKEWYYPSNTVEPRPLDGWKYEVADCYYAPPSLSYDHDGRQNYHDTSVDLYHYPYEHQIMIENETTSSRNKEIRDASLANGYYSNYSHDTHFDDYDYTNSNAAAPVHSAKSRNISIGYCSFIPVRGDKKREDQSSSKKSNVVYVEPPSLLPASSNFDNESDPIEPSSRSLNEAYSTMMVSGAARMSDPPLLAKDECNRKSGEEDADIFGQEKALLDEARRCINMDSSDDRDDPFMSSSFSFSW
ncbi:hypothetical protein CTEN210_11631 [Chaetoceros tenuissimus]|uniref:HSF-type DNA-binding domain-containing protein n=1 Tax=Chaetoceros tenuissimus TaxID=426638 RepID=A0AAD3D1U9_9STRA|nr:hypothetical protein CTEN210_11631 [Chaetoceros tenuissimus]